MSEALDTRSKEANEALAATIQDKEAVERQITALHDQLTPLEADIATCNREIERLMLIKTSLTTEIGNLTTDVDVKRTELDRIIAVATQTRDNLLAESRALQHDMDLQRTDLAQRIHAADERDGVLKIRERKVRHGEEVVKQNAQMMDL